MPWSGQSLARWPSWRGQSHIRTQPVLMFAETRQYLVADVTDIFLGAIFRNVARLVALVTPVSKIFIVLATQSTCSASLPPLIIVSNKFT